MVNQWVSLQDEEIVQVLAIYLDVGVSGRDPKHAYIHGPSPMQ